MIVIVSAAATAHPHHPAGQGTTMAIKSGLKCIVTYLATHVVARVRVSVCEREMLL